MPELETAVTQTPPLAPTTEMTPTVTTAPPTVSPTDPTVPTPEPMRAVQGQAAESYLRVSWSPDGKLLASGGNDPKVMVWDVEPLEPVLTLTHPDMAFSRFTSFSPNGRWLMVSEGRHTGPQVYFDVSIWDLRTGTRLERITDLASVWKVAWSPDGDVLAYSDFAAKELQFWAAPGSDAAIPENFEHPLMELVEMQWQADGTLMAAMLGGDDYRLKLWRLTAPDTLTTLNGPYTNPSAEQPDFYRLSGMAFTPDNTFLATGLEEEVRVWDLASGGVAATLPGQSSTFLHLAFSPDGQILAAGEADGTVSLWQLAAYQHLPVVPTPTPTATPVPLSNVEHFLLTSFSVPGVEPDGSGELQSLRWLDQNTLHLITAGEGTGQQRLTDYDFLNQQVINSWLAEADGDSQGVFYSPFYSPDGSQVAYWLRGDVWSGPEDDLLAVYDAATLELLFQHPASEIGTGNEIAWAADGSQIAVHTFNAIELFAVPGGEPVMTLENVIEYEEGEGYMGVIWSPDGAWIASYLTGPAIGARVPVWDASTGAVVHQRFEPPEYAHEYGQVDHITFSPDSSRLLMVSGKPEILNLLSGEVQAIPIDTSQSTFMGTGSWSADGVYVALDYRPVSSGAAASVLIWNTETGEVVDLFPRKGDCFSYCLVGKSNLIWAPNRPWVATVDEGIVSIIDAENQTLIQQDPKTAAVVRHLVWSPDGQHLAIGLAGGMVEIWAFSE